MSAAEKFNKYQSLLEADPKRGCSNHGCVFRAPGGMGTNGSCSCVREMPKFEVQGRYAALLSHARAMAAELAETLDSSEQGEER